MDAKLFLGIIALNIIAWLLCDVIELKKLRQSWVFKTYFLVHLWNSWCMSVTIVSTGSGSADPGIKWMVPTCQTVSIPSTKVDLPPN